MKRITANQFASSAVWKFGEMILRKIISTGISILLARLVAPEAYGVIALTTIFIALSDIFLTSGFTTALVRKEKVDSLDYSTVMIFSLVAASVLYAILYITAPFIAAFYKTPDLLLVLRVIALVLFPQAIGSIVSAKATREMEFKKMSILGLIGSTLSGLFGVILAYCGWGIWALVVQQLMANILGTILSVIVFKWKFLWEFSLARAKEMAGFSLGVLGSSFLDFAGNNISGLIVGKSYSATDLAYMNRGNMFPEIISLNVYGSINSIMLPTLASRQDDLDEMKRIVRRVLSLTMYLITPMMVGLVAIGDRMIPLLLTDAWNASIPFMAFACLNYGINPIRSTCYSVMHSMGKSQKTLQMEIFRISFTFILLFINVVVLKSDVYTFAATGMLGSIVNTMISQYMMKKEIGYAFSELAKDLMPSFVLSTIMLVIARIMGMLPFNNFIVMMLQIGGSLLFYIVASAITKNANFIQMVDYAKKIFKKRTMKAGKNNE